MTDARPSKAAFIIGTALTALTTLAMGAIAVMNLIKPASVVEETVKVGFSESVIVPLGVVLLASTVLYAIPRTAVLGAILLTGYLGGAVATHVHLGDAFFGPVLFPVAVGVIAWLGLYLRDTRLRSLVPLRS